MIETITLTNGMKAIVDDCDYLRLNRWSWCFHPDGYAIRTIYENGKKTVRMHQELFEYVPAGCEIDHIDGNGLNNRRENLRIVTHQQNTFNQKPHQGSTSIYKGVSYCTAKKKWRAQIMLNGSKYHLGFYEHEREAAKAYDAGAIILFGEHAWLNYPRGIYTHLEIGPMQARIDAMRKKARVQKSHGIWYDSAAGKYRASITLENSCIYLGRFCTKDEAVQMRNAVASEWCGVQVIMNQGGVYERVV